MSRFIPLTEVLRIAMLGNDDLLQRSKGRLRMWAKYVWQDMELTTVKVAKREFFKINKRTNTITLPCDFLELSSVNVVDRCGTIYPIFRNELNVKHLDIPQVEAYKNCACEFKCAHELCNTIKNYVAVTTTKTDEMPDGSPVSFTCIDRKAVNAEGFFIEELQYPLHVYEDGVWTDTVLHTETNKLCRVECDENGCPCDSEANIDAVCNACGINSGQSDIPFGGNANCGPTPSTQEWIYWCSTKLDWFSVQCGCFPSGFRHGCNNVYNISEDGNRLIFPHNFGFDKVLIRYYSDVNVNDLEIPYIALDTFIMGLKWWDARFNDNKQNLATKYEADYTKLKWGLLSELNKYRLQEMRMILTPPVYVPSFLPLNGYYGCGFSVAQVSNGYNN